MLHSRAAIYFDEVARLGSIRRASEALHIAPSAIDRQILQLEQHLGNPLFERLPRGLRLTAAGELLVEAVRRWRREYDRVQSHIDDLQGLRRGKVSIAMVEGAADFIASCLRAFHVKYGAIEHFIRVAGAREIADLVTSGEVDMGIVFNPPTSAALRVERTLLYQLGLMVTPDHALAGRERISISECDYPIVGPDESISLRAIINEVWHKAVGHPVRLSMTTNSMSMLKTLVLNGIGVGLVTEMDIYAETRAGSLVFVPLQESVPMSVLAVITASGRTLSVPASLLVQQLVSAMMQEEVPGI